MRGIECIGYRALGSAVIGRAIEDAKLDHTHYISDRDLESVLEAIAFLCDTNAGLDFWCELAGIDPQVVRKQSLRMFTRTRFVLEGMKATRSVTEAEVKRGRPRKDRIA